VSKFKKGKIQNKTKRRPVSSTGTDGRS